MKPLIVALVPLLLLGVASCARTATSFSDILEDEWEAWKLHYAKNYTTDVEDNIRMNIYRENREMIDEHNRLAYAGDKSYFLRMNHFGDLLRHEFTQMMNGFNYEQQKKHNLIKDCSSTYLRPSHVHPPPDIDWRDRGAVTPVKNQGACGSCWAFSTTGSLEGQHFRKTGKLVSLSEQNLVDCSGSFGNGGCLGGLMDNAFRYIKANGGVDTERSYPYEGLDERCHFKPGDVGATDSGYVVIRPGSEEDLKNAVATVGPVSIAIDASHQSFTFYSHGVYVEPECDRLLLDHGVLAVGYGTAQNGGDYWLVKNSWSKKWGIDGYIKMARNRDNQCGVASNASYPLV